MNKFSVIFVTVVLLAGSTLGCAGDGGSISQSYQPGQIPGGALAIGNGVLQVNVTDAPPKEVSAVVVKASSIEVHNAASTDNESWVTVLKDPPAFDLVKVSGVTAFLGAAQLPAGRYTQVRLAITDVTVTMAGKEIKATVPSEQLKLVGNIVITEGQQTAVTLDFDGEKSVVIAGKETVHLKPVVKLIVGNPERVRGASDNASPNLNPPRGQGSPRGGTDNLTAPGGNNGRGGPGGGVPPSNRPPART
jgi:hypothetical protein